MNRRTITLTDRAPVSIVELDWPVIAEAIERQDRNGAKATIKVRAHQDGRRIVYGTSVSGFPRQQTRAAGFVLEPGCADETAPKITAVGLLIKQPELAAECIARLPAEVLT